jgi:hypothetical protein
MLHMVSFRAPTLPTRPLALFLKTLPYVLPCKYCRASLSDYYFADPIPTDSAEMAEWMYRIHNRVNGKLREQKLLDAPNPKWDEVKHRYEEWGAAPCSARRMVGWDFLFSIANTTPSTSTRSTPMPGAPPTLPTPALRNRWNVMTASERFSYIEMWWDALGKVLPFEEWRAAWRGALERHGAAPVQKGRRAMVSWLYAMERAVCRHLHEETPHNTFEGLCSELATFRSECGKSKRSKTCRSTKQHARKTLKHRRRQTYKAIGGFL